MVELARLLARALAGLADSVTGPPPVVAHPWRGGPASVLLDLAVTAAGAWSLPWPGAGAVAAGAVTADAVTTGAGSPGDPPAGLWWLPLPGEPGEPPPELPAADPLPLAACRGRVDELLTVAGRSPGDSGPEDGGAEPPGTEGPGAEGATGGGVVVAEPVRAGAEPGGAAAPNPTALRGVAWPTLLAAGRALDRELEDRELDDRAAGSRPANGAPRREILVVAGSPLEPARRRLLAWALLRGAAVVLEPRPASLVGTALWARPTVFAGTPARVAELLRRAAPGARGGRRRLWRLGRPAPPLGPLTGRLHTCLLLPRATRRPPAAELTAEDLRDLAGDTDLRILRIEARITSSPRRNSTEELND